MQHLISKYRDEDVENEVPVEEFFAERTRWPANDSALGAPLNDITPTAVITNSKIMV